MMKERMEFYRLGPKYISGVPTGPDDNSDQPICAQADELAEIWEIPGVRRSVCRAYGRHRGSCATPLAGVGHEI